MATFSNRDGRWQAKIRRQGFPSKSKAFSSKAEAERWARSEEADMDRGTWSDRSAANRLLFGDAVQRWQDTVLVKLADTTQAPDKVRCKNLKIDPISKIAIGRLRPLDILELIDRCDDAGRKEGTTYHYVMIVSRVINAAREIWEMPYLVNPVASLPKERKAYIRRTGREARRLVDDEETRLLLNSSVQMQRVIRFAVATAMRRGEIAQLRWTEVYRNQRHLIALDTKNDDNRSVPLSIVALRILNELEQPDDLNQTVFGMSAGAITSAMQDTCARANIHNLRFHDLRHEAISRMSRSGRLPTVRLAAISGHKTLQMLRKYDHPTPDELADALDGV